MRIGLFIPCFIDAFFPEVGVATLELLERFGQRLSCLTFFPPFQSLKNEPVTARYPEYTSRNRDSLELLRFDFN